MIWIFLTVLGVVTAALLALPILSGKAAQATRQDQALAIFKDQLAELSRDEERGMITRADAQSAEIEIKRRMLAAGKKETDQARRSGPLSVIIIALLVPVAGLALYAGIGTPEQRTVPFAERADEYERLQEVTQLTNRVRARLEADPQGGDSEGWMLLGNAYARMGRMEDAVDAYRIVSERDDVPAGAHTIFAEALITTNNGVTPEASAALDRALAVEPRHPAANFYRALEEDQNGQTEKGYTRVIELLENPPEPGEWMVSFVDLANRLGTDIGKDPVSISDFMPETGPGPSAEDVEAAQEMSEEDRMAFIRSMVDGLAARLEDEPDDLGGWLRLIRAYGVLGETEKRRDALETARAVAAARPADDPERLQLDAITE